MSDDRDEQPRDIAHPQARPDQLDPATLERPTTAGQITPGPGLSPARGVENVSTDLPARAPSAPDRGIVRTRAELINQHDQTVMHVVAINLLLRRGAPPGERSG